MIKDLTASNFAKIIGKDKYNSQFEIIMKLLGVDLKDVIAEEYKLRGAIVENKVINYISKDTLINPIIKDIKKDKYYATFNIDNYENVEYNFWYPLNKFCCMPDLIHINNKDKKVVVYDVKAIANTKTSAKKFNDFKKYNKDLTAIIFQLLFECWIIEKKFNYKVDRFTILAYPTCPNVFNHMKIIDDQVDTLSAVKKWVNDFQFDSSKIIKIDYDYEETKKLYNLDDEIEKAKNIYDKYVYLAEQFIPKTQKDRNIFQKHRFDYLNKLKERKEFLKNIK